MLVLFQYHQYLTIYLRFQEFLPKISKPTPVFQYVSRTQSCLNLWPQIGKSFEILALGRESLQFRSVKRWIWLWSYLRKMLWFLFQSCSFSSLQSSLHPSCSFSFSQKRRCYSQLGFRREMKLFSSFAGLFEQSLQPRGCPL